MIPSSGNNFFSRFREFLWNYPEYLFGKKGVMTSLYDFYLSVRPFSHIIVLIIVFVGIGIVSSSDALSLARRQDKVLIEGVIMGEGNLSRINPLLPTNNQLEIDLAQLMYFPLVRVGPEGVVIPILAQSWEEIDTEGKEYKFHLRNDVLWHDGEQFDADDVMASFSVLKLLEADVRTKYTSLASGLEIVKEDNYTLTFKLKNRIPTFFEDISIGILPEHILRDVSISTFSWAKFNLHPVGTGPFKLTALSDKKIVFQANEKYFGQKPYIQTLELRMYENGDDAIEAIKNGEIHLLADPSTAILSELDGWSNIKTIKSASQYRRYLALYFNMKEGAIDIFKDKVVRQAISNAISRDTIISNVEGAGEEAMGPIPVNSWAYNEDAKRYRYNVEEAKAMLEKSGWEEKEVGGKIVRMKDDVVLRFELSYLDRYDREIVAQSIKSDLEKIGIIVNLNAVSSEDLNAALVATRNFDAVLYGVKTPIDPDRIRLWHSDAIPYPGLNISSYETTQQGAIPGQGGELERISLIDATLENGYSGLTHDERIGGEGINAGYKKFQEVLLEDGPIVFLYHPVFIYVAHSRVKGIDLSQMTVPEDRYLSITDWRIE